MKRHSLQLHCAGAAQRSGASERGRGVRLCGVSIPPRACAPLLRPQWIPEGSAQGPLRPLRGPQRGRLRGSLRGWLAVPSSGSEGAGLRRTSSEVAGLRRCACEKGAKPEQALALLLEMQRHSVEPKVIRFHAALSTCEKRAQAVQALRFPREMLLQSVEPVVICCNSTHKTPPAQLFDSPCPAAAVKVQDFNAHDFGNSL